MKEQFTPGPWGRTGLCKDCPVDYIEISASNSPMWIAHVNGLFASRTYEANANLIAAAPDMYEALKKINNLLDDYFQSKDELVPAEIVEAYEIIELTLLKAHP